MIDFSIDDFLLEVYKWLMEPRNSCVTDLHELWASNMGRNAFIKEIEVFMRQRFVQTHPNEKVDDDFIHMCACEYAKEF